MVLQGLEIECFKTYVAKINITLVEISHFSKEKELKFSYNVLKLFLWCIQFTITTCLFIHGCFQVLRVFTVTAKFMRLALIVMVYNFQPEISVAFNE